MAYTEIHAITSTLNKAIDYVKNDKSRLMKDDLKDAIAYVEKDKENNLIIYKTKTSTIGCNTDTANEAFTYIRNIHANRRTQHLKDNGRENIAWHCIQTFKEKVDIDIANEIGKRLAEECFSEYQCIISTHTNTEHTHNHIVFNAWAISDGKKYNDCNDTKRKIRNVSDRLCEEYGLHIIEETRDFKPIKWVDDKGKTHFYEPTERKDKLRHGAFSNSNDYRNAEAYTTIEKYKKTNREEVKSDIDKLLPNVKSYEELLSLLREIGYEINDKKVNGDWLSHVSFKAPFQDKSTRDYKIGEEYTREKLIALIDQNNQNKNTEKDKKSSDVVPISDNSIYQFGKINVDDINENYKKRRIAESAEYEKVMRGEVERFIISDVKKLNIEIQIIYKQATIIQQDKSEPVLKNRKSQYLLDRINSNLRALKFVESKNIQSFTQINSIVSLLYDKRNKAQSELEKVKYALEKANENITLIEKFNSVKTRIDKQQGNKDYINYELQSDNTILKNYETILKQRNLGEEEQKGKFVENYRKYYNAYEQLANALNSINMQIKEYDDCVKTISRIDRANTNRYSAEVKQYYNIRTEQIPKAKNNENNEMKKVKKLERE